MSRTLSHVVALGWTLGILLACSLPGSSIPTPSMGLDKVAHFVLFAGLGVAWMAALASPLRRRAYLVLTLGTLYACFTEVYQGWLPWEREPDPFDALANVLGLAVGVLLYFLRRRAAG